MYLSCRCELDGPLLRCMILCKSQFQVDGPNGLVQASVLHLSMNRKQEDMSV